MSVIAAASASAAPGLTTMGHTVVIGAADPGNGGYCMLEWGDGEPHVLRTDLTSTVSPVTFALASFAQMTDLHVVDDQSTLRVELLDRYANPGPPHEASYPTSAAYRAHESLSAQVVDAMCRALSSIRLGPRTGMPLAFTIVTGDAVDNCQFNEVRWYVDLLDGQAVTPNSGASNFDHSVTGDSLGLDINYWHPSNKQFEISNTHGPGLDLNFQAGFPEILQMPSAARRSFTPHGLGMPWFAAVGNHDRLVQGNAPIDADFIPLDMQGIAAGTFKRTDIAEPLPAKFTGDLFDYTAFIKLVVFQDFAGVLVPADPRRRLLSRREFMNEHFDTQGRPAGHGFSFDSDQADYVIPDAEDGLIRHVVLDTSASLGARGAFAPEQRLWLEDLLKANSSYYLTDEAQPKVIEQSGVRDKLFVIHSHHMLRAMGSDGEELKRLLLRFPNVILQVNGHNHKNEIKPQFRPWAGTTPGGFWEVSTASAIDWPVQGRLFDITAGGGTISIFTTMADIDAPLDFRQGDIHDPAVLASLSRELAANDLQQRGTGVAHHRADTGDRNAQLVLPAPFPLPDPVIFGSPIAASRGMQAALPRLVLFGCDSEDRIWHGPFTANSVTWSQLDGALRCACIETNADGRLELFGVNTAGQPFHRWEESPGSDVWSPWAGLDGRLTSIAVARNLDGRLEVFGCDMFERGIPDGPVGPLWHSVQTTAGAATLTGWSPLDSLAGTGLAQVAAATNINGCIELFGVTSQGAQVVHAVQTSPGSWAGSQWRGLDGTVNAIAVGSGSGGMIDLFASDEDGRVLHRRQTAPGAHNWTDWTQLDADWARFTIRQLAVGNRGDALTLLGVKLTLFGVNADGQVFYRTQTALDPPAWGPWTALPGALRPTLLPNTAPRVSSPGDQGTLLGTPVSLTLTEVGGVAPITWTFSGLPAGLAGTNTGQITGTPLPSGTATHLVTATATDANHTSTTVSFTWTTLVTLPDVQGSPRQEAITEIHNAHLTLGTVGLDHNCIETAGTVVSQNPPAGGQAPEGSAVSLSVSSGHDTHGHKCTENK